MSDLVKADEHRRLMIEIARCPLVRSNVETDQERHPCRLVVTHQWPGIAAAERRSRWEREHHVPEPWVGHIQSAPLLFLSSNPSISSKRRAAAPKPEDFAKPLKRLGEHTVRQHRALRHGLSAPKPNWDDDEIEDRYENALAVWSVNGTHAVADEDGTMGDRVPFWEGAREVAEAIFNRGDVRPGIHYALSEVVHCKSKGEDGVKEAVKVCSALYLPRVLRLSPARLIVVFGAYARNAVRDLFDYPDAGVITKPILVSGCRRRFVFMAHPANRQRRPKYPRQLRGADLDEARKAFGGRRAR